MSPRVRVLALLSPLVSMHCGGGPGGAGAEASTGAGSSGGASTMDAPTSSGTTDAEGGGSEGATSGESEGASGSSDSGESGSSGEVPFVIDCVTSLVPAQGLALTCNVPRTVEACVAAPGLVCDDVDQDTLVDAWEDIVLERLRPIQRLDEQETLVNDPTAVLGTVGRVAPVAGHVRVFMMLGYSKDYGSCGGFTGHNGDPERVALDLVPDPERGAGGVVVASAYTAAHENTENDHSEVFTGAGLGELVYDVDLETGKPRWVVYPSADKHGTYASVEICEMVSAIPCIDEDCGPDDVADPKAFDRLSVIVNAGEEAAPRVTELSVIGFPGDQAWAMQDFCGGLGGGECSAQVRDKLLVDPFL